MRFIQNIRRLPNIEMFRFYAGRSLGNININGKRLVSDSGHLHKKVCLSGEVRIPHARVKTSNGDTVTEEKKVEKIDPKLCSKYPELFEPHTFAPKDLLALLKNLEHEISVCETSLKDENDKRNKYKVGLMRMTKRLLFLTAKMQLIAMIFRPIFHDYKSIYAYN